MVGAGADRLAARFWPSAPVWKLLEALVKIPLVILGGVRKCLISMPHICQLCMLKDLSLSFPRIPPSHA